VGNYAAIYFLIPDKGISSGTRKFND